MDPNDTAQASLDAMQAQVMQSMIEHQLVVQALWAVCGVFLAFVVLSACIWFYLIRRLSSLSEASVEQEKRHSSEKLETGKRHSLELQSNGMQFLHAFEGIVQAKRRG